MSYRLHDEIIEQMSPYGCVLKNSLSNHTPMVVEALAAMDADEAAALWFKKNESTILPKPPLKTPIDYASWQAQVSDLSRFSDWAEFFAAEIDQLGWQPCAQKWVSELTPAFISAACHGVIRVGHAVRALQQAETPPRLRELSYALASWCVSYMLLPAPDTIDPQPGRFNGDTLLYKLPLLDPALRKNDTSITRAIAQLKHAPHILASAQKLALNAAADDISHLAHAAAQVFLHNAKTPLGAIVFTHGITGSAASLHLSQILDESAQRHLTYHAFLAVAALHAVYAETPLSPLCKDGEANKRRGEDLGAEQLRKQAIEHGDDHVIKLTEACLLFYRLTREPTFLSAAQLGHDIIPPE